VRAKGGAGISLISGKIHEKVRKMIRLNRNSLIESIS
jgi:hypothetical protein